MGLAKQLFFISILLVSTSSFALSLGVIQRTQSGDFVAATQSEAVAICNQKGLQLPTPKDLAQIVSNPGNFKELEGAAFWSSEKGTLLMGDYRWIGTGYSWDSLVAGIICR